MSLLDSKITIFIFLTVCIVIYGINRKIKEPYMDEIFHIPQTHTFCKGKWTQYHDKITTLPGLYILPALISQIFQSLIPTLIPIVSCSISYLRIFNIVYAILCIPLIREIIWNLHGQYIESLLQPIARKINEKSIFKLVKLKEHDFDQIIDVIKNHFTLEIVLFPLNYFYIFLVYTDIPSTFWLLSSYLCYLKLFENESSIKDLKKQIFAFLLGFISVLHRQTNIIWIGFYFLLSIYDLYSLKRYSKNGEIDRTQFSKRSLNIIDFITYCWNFKYHIIQILWYYLLLFIGFILFVIINGSIVLGDKSHHIFTLHLAQILYLYGILLSFIMIPSIIQQILSSFNTMKLIQFIKSNLMIIVILFVLFTIFRIKFTVIHEFLLSDNRHYSFYIWRYFLSKTWFTFIIIPITVFAAIYIDYEIKNILSISKYWYLSFIICCLMVLIPTPLFEFRYFIIPIIIFKLNYLCNHQIMKSLINEWILEHFKNLYKEKEGIMTLPMLNFLTQIPNINPFKWLNIMIYLTINIVTLYVYIAKPFKWVDNTTARFMW